MTLEIKIKMKGLSGKKIILSDDEKRILSGMIQFVIGNYGGLTAQWIKEYASYSEKNTDKQSVRNAAFYLRMIGEHIHSFDVTKVEVK